jgi:gliding motility-associated lipoprotein GldH
MINFFLSNFYKKHTVWPCMPVIFLCIFFVSSCKQKPLYEQVIEISENSWNYKDSIKFDVFIKDTTAAYNLVLRVAHKDDFSFQNLYVKINSIMADGQSYSQIVSLNLQDRYGRWEGKCSNSVCKADILLIDHIYFRIPGEYSFVISQFSRTDNLSGIQSLRMIVERA